MLESALVDRIRASFEARGIWSMKIHGTPWQTKGVPDILGTLPPGGHGFAIEVKVPGHKSRDRCLRGDCATPIQTYQLREIGKTGALVGIAHSIDEALAIIHGENQWLNQHKQ